MYSQANGRIAGRWAVLRQELGAALLVSGAKSSATRAGKFICKSNGGFVLHSRHSKARRDGTTRGAREIDLEVAYPFSVISPSCVTIKQC